MRVSFTRLIQGACRYLLHRSVRLIGINFRLRGWLYGNTFKGHELPFMFFVDDYWVDMQAWERELNA